MLPDKKIDSLDSHLEHFKLQDCARQNDLKHVLAEYRQLLTEYKVLKRAHEDTITNAIAKPVSVATSNVVAETRSRDSYVLMLVDGNDYIFNDEFISDKEEGGMRAARKLNDAIDKYIDQNVPKALSRRVIVRIYANVTNLSKQLGRLKLTGLEKRSVADFTAGFTRAIGLFDFIDTLDDEGTKFKIREQFKIASDDAACSHILFAACNDPAYLSQLLSYNGARDKITLIQGSKWNPEFHQFNFEVTQFPTIFSWSGIPSVLPAEKAAPPATAKAKAPVPPPMLKPASLALQKESWRRNDPASLAESVSGHLSLVSTARPQTSRDHSWRRNAPASATESAFGDSSLEEANDLVDQELESARWDSPPPRDRAPRSTANRPSSEESVCRFFQKGNCRYESKCRYSHDLQNLNGHSNGSQVSKPLLSPTLQSVSGASSAQAPAATSQQSQGAMKEHVDLLSSQYSEDVMDDPSGYSSSQHSQNAMKDRVGLSASLPQETVPGFILLNRFSQRLDPYMPEPTAHDWKVYNTRFQKSKPCNSYQLEGHCSAVGCRFDHSKLTPQVMRVLEYMVRRIPCTRKGACRKPHCTHGHLCQKEDCSKIQGVGTKHCRFRWDLHYSVEECKLGSMVPAEEVEEPTETVNGDEKSGLTEDDLVPMEEVDLLW